MNNHLAEAPTNAGLLPDDLSLGPVHLTVTDVERSADFYERAIGLRPSPREGDEIRLGAGNGDLLVLHGRADAKRAGRHAGLYHFALLHPTRQELARAVRRLAESGTPISGASDHGISEAIYLPDPDGNGIELAADRPPERWGDLRDPTTIGPAPLDLPGLIATIASEDPSPHADRDVRVGHLHMHVGDIPDALAYWRDVIGFAVMTDMGSAAFIAAGGYHHHLGLNVWRGEGVPPVPADAVGLDHWTVNIDHAAIAALTERLERAKVPFRADGEGLLTADPWGMKTLFVP